MTWHDRVSYFCRTDVGIKRSHNQDSLGVAKAPTEEVWRARGHLFLVADGMGAHAVGELASKLAVDSISHVYGKCKGADYQAALCNAFLEANQIIHDKGLQNPEFRGMGTTATALVLAPDGAHLGHVGDSRCYRIRDDTIEQLSFDHSLQWEIARRQNLRPEQLSSVPANIIVRSLGPEAHVRVDSSGPYPVQEGDRFLLCSDGLSGPVADEELWAAVTHLPGEEACQFLVDLANLRGGIDNITVLIVQVGDPQSAPKIDRPKRFWPNVWERLRQALAEIPAPGWLTLTGLTTAVIGYTLRLSGLPGTAFALLLGMCLLVGALYGFMFRRRRQERLAARLPAGPPPVHRRRQCQLERSFVGKLARMQESLRELAIEESWRVDWGPLHRCRAAAAECEDKHDSAAAFREYCRAISILSAGFRERRDKHEVFIPHWTKEPGG